MRWISGRRPSPAMVVSLIALVIAASGTAMAATKLVSGDKLIRKGSLSGNRLRNHTLSGRQIKLAALGTVPNASHANTADTAGATGNATNANHANTADNATNANHASSADKATNATNAANATNAENANTATDATSATSATNADNATNFGGEPPSFYQSACQNGVVAAHVYVKGSASFLSTYTTSPSRIQEPFNCTGGVVEVERTGAGVYRVHFGGLDNGAQLIAVGNQSVTPLGAAVSGGEVTFKLVFDATAGGTVYQVTLDDTSGVAVDNEFSFALLSPS